MPILPAEPALFPDDVLDAPVGLTAGDEWRVLHTRPRQEKGLARDLLARAVPFFLPTIRRPHRSAGRIRVAEVPLFDGYVFLRADRDQYLDALDTGRVVRALVVRDQAGLVSDLRRLHALLGLGRAVERERQLRAGQAVEITAGPLAGFRGTVVRAATGTRFVVAVDFIREGASVTCEGMALRPLGPAD
ncbi:MAG TPA: transcription termination/antitermination NusG family protein [Gemmataceae bacterium]|nr:transcription termination/antitermination NusG family protein [Gemmataceae bacterium]